MAGGLNNIMNRHSTEGQIAFDVETLINECQPHSILTIGNKAETFIADYVAQKKQLNQECAVTSLDADDALSILQKAAARYEAAIVVDALEFMDKEQAGQLIARLRDLQADRFIAIVRMGDQWKQTKSTWQTVDLLGYGMKLVNRHHTGAKPVHIYKYDIATYKKTPEWLNARNWANPKLWDRFRW